MGLAILHCECFACGAPMVCNPMRVPSIRDAAGSRQPICGRCFDRWNEIHRTSKGLDPIPLAPDAYEACDENELD